MNLVNFCMPHEPKGYSKTPLAKKLGIKPGFRLKLVNAPDHYFDLFTDMPESVDKDSKGKMDMVHFFTKDEKELVRLLPKFKTDIMQNGMIWVSWPKKSAKVITDVSENMIRDVALGIGLVDIKVCAVDDVWSGLKLVIPVSDRVRGS